MADLRLPKLNKVVVSGRITNDIELKYTPKGTPVVRFSIAVDKSYKDDSGNWQNLASFIDCIAWNKTAEILSNNSHKGSAVIVEGRIDSRTYVDSNNQNRKQTEIIADTIHNLEWKPKTEGEADVNSEPPLPDEVPAPATNATNDDVPF
ncbi:MAG: single-stranded DNA-binding protein [Candidatus Cloacimonetes bacterium]|nr:single-stranded DNA-binding protein [Candidatus Cloacimonadota bacterium]